MSELPEMDVVELNLDEVASSLARFKTYTQGRELDEVEQAAVMAVPMFELLTEQMMTWGGDAATLPNAEDLINRVNDFVLVINMYSNSVQQECVA